MRFSPVFAAAFLVSAMGLSGCQSASHALGMGKVVPDEFRVVTKAPLILPPDYSLRPPAPGEPRPQELQPESAARQALLGQRQAEVRSDGEKLLASKAGADKADPLIRYVVDDDFGALAHKDKGFADWVMFWRHGQPATAPGLPAATGGDTPTPVDAAAEATRIQGLTGNQPVVIARRTSTKTKLPGL
jgi:hypothetical protein